MKRLFVDMDGTLAEFRTITKIEELYEKGYFENLTPLPNVIDAVKLISKNPDVEVYILSSVLTDSAYALGEKNRWLDKHLPEIPRERRFFPSCGSSKRASIDLRGNDFLLDDYSRNLHDWEPPGIGIKLMNGINGRFGSWTKDRVDAGLSGKELAKDILDDMGVSMMIKNIHLEGHVGTFYAIDQDTIYGNNLLLLESEQYGDETACVITDTDFKVVLEDVWNGFDDYIEQLDREEKKMIQFCTSDYWPLFQIPSGDNIILTLADGSQRVKNCTYIDEHHALIGEDICSLSQFAVQAEHDGVTYEPEISVLPEQCFTENPENGEVVIIKRGESGYYPISAVQNEGENFGKVTRLNKSIGVDKRQAAAMLAGSMFGWNVPAADPMKYDMFGEYKKVEALLTEENSFVEKIDIHEMIDKFDSYISYVYATDQYTDLSKAADTLNRDFEAREYIADLPDGRKLIMHELTEVARTDDGEPGDFGEETKQWYFIEGKNGKREQLSSDEVEAKSINLSAHGNKTNNQYDRNIESEAMER